MRPAVFLDRDGTIIRMVDYISDPAHVELIDGAAEAIVALRAAGYACIVVTNQSGIGRGYYTEDDFQAVQCEMDRQLAERGAQVDGVYFCPVAPDSSDLTTIDHVDRKPGPGMLLRAAKEHGLDLSRSWMIGDMPSDTLAGRNAGCGGCILVRSGKDHGVEDVPSADHVVADIQQAARLILGATT